jgi:predicted MFS family arabinose efflux permease
LSGLFIALSPVGSGAAGNFWPSISDHWHASSEMVEAVNGWLGGIIGGVGALAGGWLAERIQRRNAYALAGACTAISGLIFAITPREPWAFATMVLVYTFFNGVAYGAFSAFVLETIGHGAVATKYNIFASLANLAISYMTTIDAQAYKRVHESGMLVVDAVCTFIGIAVLIALIRLVRWVAARRPPAAPEAPA